MTESLPTDELLALARFQRLDARNSGEEAKLKLLSVMADEIERLRGVMTKIAAYDPGRFRPLADEIAIWKLATDALHPDVEGGK